MSERVGASKRRVHKKLPVADSIENNNSIHRLPTNVIMSTLNPPTAPRVRRDAFLANFDVVHHLGQSFLKPDEYLNMIKALVPAKFAVLYSMTTARFRRRSLKRRRRKTLASRFSRGRPRYGGRGCVNASR